MAAHLHWGLLLSGPTTIRVAELEMRINAGGADQCTGGTAGTSLVDAGYSAANGFDNDIGTFWQANAPVAGARLSYAFAAPVDIV